jgi:MFS family permease
MKSNTTIAPEKKKSVHALEATNFFLADVQTGLGPFLAAYLAGAGWEPGRVGMALTVGGIVTVALQAPAGALVDQLRSKRRILVIASAILALGAVLLTFTAAPWAVYTSQVLIGGAGPFLGPTLAAVTMGIVGVTFFDRQFGKNQSFNSAGNVACALLIAGVSHLFGNRAIFITAALLTIPTVLAIRAIKSSDVDYELARGGAILVEGKEVPARMSVLKTLLGDRILLISLAPFSSTLPMRLCSHNLARCCRTARELPPPPSCLPASSSRRSSSCASLRPLDGSPTCVAESRC